MNKFIFKNKKIIQKSRKRKLFTAHYFTLTIFLLTAHCSLLTVYAQDFGFGFDSQEVSSSSNVSFSFGGEIGIELPFYFTNYKFDWKELPRGKINFNISSKYIDVITGFNLNYYSIEEFWNKDSNWGQYNHNPFFIDEAFLRTYLGSFNIEAGFKKLTWGRADSFGPLDITNPYDFSDLRRLTNINATKIPRPMLRINFNAGDFTKLEGVFIPNFSPHRFAQDTRWVPSQLNTYENALSSEIRSMINPSDFNLNIFELLVLNSRINSSVRDYFNNYDFFDNSKIEKLEYFQAGLRYTTTIGSIDLGGQYFYGNLFRPSITIDGINIFVQGIIDTNGTSIDPSLIKPNIIYTRYHMAGIDYAQVLEGFNIRAEFAYNLTEDFDGSDGTKQNPFIAWSLGFDRDLIWQINLNLQCNQTIRMFHNKVKDNPLIDCEANLNLTATRITAMLSKKLLRDNFETKAIAIWDIENSDCYLIPSVSYIFKDFLFDVTAGFFLGSKNGELGQYKDNSFIKLSVTYKF